MSDIKKYSQFLFICGNDDYLVDREARKIFNKLSEGLADDFSKEIIDAAAQNLGKLEVIFKQFFESVQTPSLFGENKVVWLRAINFLEDAPLGCSESAKIQIDNLVEILEGLNYDSITVILSASPVDKRTRGFRSLKNKSHFQLIEDESDPKGLAKITVEECKKCGISITPEAIQALLAKVNNNARLLIQEIEKLTTYLGNDKRTIDIKLVTEMVSQFGENDFFEFSEAFFSLDLKRTLDALTRYFFIQKESRLLITSIFNKLRLLIQLRVLLDGKSIESSSYGIDKNTIEKLVNKYQLSIDEGQNKSAFNVFSQNPWYLGKLLTIAKKIALKNLIDIDFALIRVFEAILKSSNSQEQEMIMRQFVIECLQ